MEERLTKLLTDIKMAIDEIEFFQGGKPLKLIDYKNDSKLKRAIERDLEIIGEAVNKLLLIKKDFPIENARKIVGLRNQIIHSYDNISDEMIFSIVINHLPKLKLEVEKLLTQ